MSSGVSKIFSVFATVVFAVMTLAMLVMALVISGQMLVATLLALVFGVLTLLFGYRTLQHISGPEGAVDISGLAQERTRILRFASSRQGRLTAEEASMGCSISVRQAQALLDDLVNQGSAETWISDGGSMVYVFRGLLEAEEKASAEDPMKFLDS